MAVRSRTGLFRVETLFGGFCLKANSTFHTPIPHSTPHGEQHHSGSFVTVTLTLVLLENMKAYIAFSVLCSIFSPSTGLVHRKPPPEYKGKPVAVSRRSAIINIAIPTTAAAVLLVAGTDDDAKAAGPNGLPLRTATSGLKWADAKVGSGQPVQNGAAVSIDYSMASTVGRQPQIYTTKDKGTPYRWTLGDGSTIQGIEQAILGTKDGDVPPMLPGGVRRVVIPAKLGYESILSESKPKCLEGEDIGPIPPKANSDGAYQRWYQFYCNPRIPYQPDIVMDIKLYGKRTQ